MLIAEKNGAERLATAILQDITFDNEERVRASRDLTTDLAAEIAEGRALFQSRVEASLHHVFDDELVVWRGTAHDRVKKLAPTSIDPTRLLLAVAGLAALVALIVWFVMR